MASDTRDSRWSPAYRQQQQLMTAADHVGVTECGGNYTSGISLAAIVPVIKPTKLVAADLQTAVW